MKLRRLLPLFACVALFTASQAQGAGYDPKAGKALVDAHCMACHDTSVFTRANRRVNSLAALDRQVQRCQMSQNYHWSKQQIDDVVGYLNQAFYHVK